MHIGTQNSLCIQVLVDFVAGKLLSAVMFCEYTFLQG